MKKKILKWFIYSIIVLILFILGINSFKKINEKKIVKENIQKFHDFCIFTVGGNHELCTKLLPTQPIIILFIHPECDSCHEEVKQLKEYQTEFQNISILLVTSASLQQAIDFYSNQNLSLFDNIKLCLDEDFKISDHFGINTIPSVFLYNQDKELIFKHKGEIKIETLISYLSEI
ncbi:MAG: redoxin domain-containing protein [Dysgonamonadaceae bacterium]|jgi:thiol-disulfide isomerase/thioredoxin|nr:redoxin domain-containing protein [Dysgonamonadaceae bacterium]